MSTSYYETYWQRSDGWNPDEGVNHPIERKIFSQLLKPGMRLIDYGCGNGERYGRDMLNRQIDYRGFDISETALANAAVLGLNVARIREDGSLPLDEASADCAMCFEVLEHLNEPDQALAAIRYALKPGSHAVFSVPNAAHYVQRIEFLLTGFWNPGGSPHTARKSPWRDPHIRFFNPSMLRRMLEASGFEVERIIGEPFTFQALPWFYKQKKLLPFLTLLSKPFAWLGTRFPGLWSARLFAIVRKPQR
ncbi:MAG: class I SAM-dependent methyltransferase [Prosthecobacter sp.]|jgi:SAM-dependent methyltransferase|uniref:class I SAM-dependent methyltransferase n=1 Tax=Prosthecobacter sp. TaxID=1965333 RepID=UPI001A02B2F6|nr:class I SAM-dependent methyltransferase [Prosthecobacter sp.]MBE2283716.1 class I SAM-dependent methyltransferase [Prosthecobacter sp.]